MNEVVTVRPTEWWIVLGKPALVGLLDANALSPVYELISGKLPSIAMTPQGPAMVVANLAPVVGPVMGLASIRSIEVPDDAILIRVNSLDDADRRAVMAAIGACEDEMRKARAAASGIVLPDASAMRAMQGGRP